jgi:hypothetical protein
MLAFVARWSLFRGSLYNTICNWAFKMVAIVARLSLFRSGSRSCLTVVISLVDALGRLALTTDASTSTNFKFRITEYPRLRLLFIFSFLGRHFGGGKSRVRNSSPSFQSGFALFYFFALIFRQSSFSTPTKITYVLLFLNLKFFRFV